MNRKLLRQTANEWQSNVWLALELLIVSVVMWFIADFLFTNISIINEPRGFDTDHCYLIKYSRLNEKSPDYISDLTEQQQNDHLLQLLDRLRHRPEISSVAMGQNAYFYNGSNSGTYMEHDTLNTGNSYNVRRYVSADFVRVFRIRGANGETPEQLAEILSASPNGFLISDNAFNHYGIEHMKDFIGKDFMNGANNDTITLRAAYIPTRYDDYSPVESSVSMIRCIPETDMLWLNELVVRVRDNMDSDFINNLMKDAPTSLRCGNYYITAVQSFDDIRNIHQRDNDAEMRNYFIGAAFLALNIFLGLLGTFWFRTRQRVPEIALRKVNGATHSDIFRRVIGEGQLILLLVTPIAIAFDWFLTKYEFNTYYGGGYLEPVRFISCVLIAWGLMALMILLGTAIPANRAMNIAPATALNEE